MSTSDELNALLNKIIWYITYYSHGFTTAKVVKKNTSFWMLFPVKVIMYIHCRTFQENQGVDPTPQPPPTFKLKKMYLQFSLLLGWVCLCFLPLSIKLNLFINRYYNWEGSSSGTIHWLEHCRSALSWGFLSSSKAEQSRDW